VTPDWQPSGREPRTSSGKPGIPTVTARPSNLNGHVVHSKFSSDRDLEREDVAGLDSHGVVSGDDIELARQERLGKPGQAERRGVPANAPPEPGGDGEHGGTLPPKCCRPVTRPERLGDGAEVGGYPRNLNVILARSPAALP
jgi:hypothetical protein